MTHPMTDERLAELRDIAGLSFPVDEWWSLHHDKYPDREIGIECVRELLARLDAAEELIREVAREAVESKHTIEISGDVLEKCRSYLR